MLKFNLKKIFALRGIEKTTAFLVNLGMSYPAASRYLKPNRQTIRIGDIENLCVALNCTPNDLFEWKPDQKTALPEAHSLNALKKGDKQKNLRELVKDIPSEKLSLIEDLLSDLKSQTPYQY
jgi:DNA-binding Xre family transcriptional regulator